MAKANGSLKELPLNKIQASPVALRVVDKTKQRYQELVDSIKIMGVMNPIIVREIKHPDTKELVYSVVDGLHRFIASGDAGKESIPCHIMAIDEANLHFAQIIGNVQKIETRAAEYAEALVRILTADPTMTISELATKLGKSPAWLDKTLSLKNINNEKIRELINGGKMKLYNAYELARLPEEEQANFLDRALTMPPGDFVPLARSRVKEIRDAKRKGKTVAPEEFVVMPKLRSMAELKKEKDSFSSGQQILVKFNLTDPVSAWKMAIDFALQLDPDSVEVRKVQEEQRKKIAKEERDRAKEERQERKMRDAAKAAAMV